MKRFFLAVVFSLLTTSVFAQDVNELAKKYVNMPEIQNMISDMFSPVAMGNQVAANLPANITLTDEKKQRIGVVMSEAMNDLRPRMETLMISTSAQIFSAGELTALIEFYGSEHGASIMAKMTPFMANVMAQLQPEMQALQNKVGPEVAKIIQE